MKIKTAAIITIALFFSTLNINAQQGDNRYFEKRDSLNKLYELQFISSSLFPKATVKVADSDSEGGVIVENNFVYRVRKGIKSKVAECSEMPIKNNNQFFDTKGNFNDYRKIVIDVKGIVTLFCTTDAGEKKLLDKARGKLTMKVIKEGFIIGKITNDRFYLKKGGDYTERGYLFKGNKTQAVICLLAVNYFS